MQEKHITGADCLIEPDVKDEELATKRIVEFDALEGPRVGDFITMPDGKTERFSHHWGDALQTSEGGSFYMGKGYVSFAGGLNPSIPIARIKPTDEKREGNFWFFHHDWAQAHSAVYMSTPCRVYIVTG